MAIHPTAPPILPRARGAPGRRGRRARSPEYETARRFPGLLEDGDAAVRSGYGSNHARLARIKGAYDPENRLRLDQNIRPAA